MCTSVKYTVMVLKYSICLVCRKEKRLVSMNSETSSARNITIDCECLQKTDSEQHFINENFIQSQLSQ